MAKAYLCNGLTKEECGQREIVAAARKKELQELAEQIFNLCKEHNLKLYEVKGVLQSNLRYLLSQCHM